MNKLTLLGIESSCDECSAAVVGYSAIPYLRVLSVSTFSQVGIHQPYGGVVPEIASRNHLETINHMIDRALGDAGLKIADIDAIAVTNRPGLVGALLVGVSAAKALAFAAQKPLIAVHHLEGHAASIFLDRELGEGPTYPLLLAIVSGGHTNLYCIQGPPEIWPPDFLKTSLIGRSRDDAAGEAFDKTAKLLGFQYPGGHKIDEMARGGNPHLFALPRALSQKSTFDMSFSGLKTAVALLVEKLRREGGIDKHLPDLCASVQEAIIDALLSKIYLAAKAYGCRSLAVVGGVAANSRLRARLGLEWQTNGFLQAPIFPELKYCGDNAAMIAGAGMFRFLQRRVLSHHELLTLNAVANPET